MKKLLLTSFALFSLALTSCAGNTVHDCAVHFESVFKLQEYLEKNNDPRVDSSLVITKEKYGDTITFNNISYYLSGLCTHGLEHNLNKEACPNLDKPSILTFLYNDDYAVFVYSEYDTGNTSNRSLSADGKNYFLFDTFTDRTEYSDVIEFTYFRYYKNSEESANKFSENSFVIKEEGNERGGMVFSSNFTIEKVKTLSNEILDLLKEKPVTIKQS